MGLIKKYLKKLINECIDEKMNKPIPVKEEKEKLEVPSVQEFVAQFAGDVEGFNLDGR